MALRDNTGEHLHVVTPSAMALGAVKKAVRTMQTDQYDRVTSWTNVSRSCRSSVRKPFAP